MLGGALMLGIGLFLGLEALRYDVGTPQRMGPGFFPVVLSGLLILMSVGLLLRGLATEQAALLGRINLRGLLLVLLPPVVFGLTVRGLGFAPATALAVLLAAGASREATPLSILLTLIVLTGFCLITFSWLLGVPYALIGPWLRSS